MTTTVRDLKTQTEPLRDVPQRPANGHDAASIGKGVLLVQSPRGLQRTPWRHDNKHEVRTAAESFRRLRAVGYRAYRLDSTTHVHKEITDFDPRAQEVLMIVPLCGGAH